MESRLISGGHLKHARYIITNKKGEMVVAAAHGAYSAHEDQLRPLGCNDELSNTSISDIVFYQDSLLLIGVKAYALQRVE